MTIALENRTADLAPMMTIHGQEGVGKTTLASKFPDAVHALLEDGLPAGVTVRAVPRIQDFIAFMALLRALYEDRSSIGAFVVDTLDVLEAMILDHVCKENGWKSIETPSFGKGWVAADIQWRRVLSALDHLRRKRGFPVVLIAHSSIERIDDPRAPSYTSYQLRLHRRARALVMDACDIIGFLSTDLHVVTEDVGFKERARADGGSTRYLFVEGRPAFAAKNRYGLPPKIAIPQDFDIRTLTNMFPTSQRGEEHEQKEPADQDSAA